ncbi:hypothetical protein A8L34_29530 [Bacillus sp. FJAT-27264]|uniref:hypothetical protein n=1 Tax=Paenibacillus sp. (strain DSM 101736 / FJAT-27264) TaxID=1850362 RepID=UPI00080815D1|nr:hypothetical protein [Bacillus sp. FJAT-27264]OBZ15202.1 hypothetical protein A8L34_29530 [Bacillus sp. FJAT-27264]
MSLDLIKVSDNGQLEFDFEALEAITSDVFVNYLKNQYLHKREIKGAKIVELEYGISLYFSLAGHREIVPDMVLSCYFSRSTRSFDVSFLTPFDVAQLSYLLSR